MFRAVFSIVLGDRFKWSATSFFAAPHASSSAICASRFVNTPPAFILSPDFGYVVFVKYRVHSVGLCCFWLYVAVSVVAKAYLICDSQGILKLGFCHLYVALAQLHVAFVKAFFVIVFRCGAVYVHFLFSLFEYFTLCFCFAFCTLLFYICTALLLNSKHSTNSSIKELY